MNLKTRLVLLICLMSHLVQAQNTPGPDFFKTLAKYFKPPRYTSQHSFFSIKFTTDKNGKLTEMRLSDDTDSLIRVEFERVQPYLNFKSLDTVLLHDSEAILPVILVYGDLDSYRWSSKPWNFNGSAAKNKKYQLLPPIIMYRSRPPHTDHSPPLPK